MKKFIKNLFNSNRQQCNLSLAINYFSYDEIKIAKNKIEEVKKMYNPHLHGWQHKDQINFTVNKMQEILDIFLTSKCSECKI